jgi:hypothetical protein
MCFAGDSGCGCGGDLSGDLGEEDLDDVFLLGITLYYIIYNKK